MVEEVGSRARLARWLEGDGIEIGALHEPLHTPPAARVSYVDRLDERGLREHYPELAEKSLVPVSVIASADDLSMFADCSLDFVIANHLLEHLEYPIKALLEFHRVLRPGGIVYMALPDRRLTFDQKREPTSIEHLLDEHRRGADATRWDHYLDWSVNVDGKSGQEATAHARRLLDKAYAIHFHVWTPDSFLDFLVAVRRELGLEFELLEFAAPELETDNEFILVMARSNGSVRHAPQPALESARVTAVTLRQRLARSPVGPPVRAVRRLVRKARAG
jgi:SAM-dependent methyltransferase